MTLKKTKKKLLSMKHTEIQILRIEHFECIHSFDNLNDWISQISNQLLCSLFNKCPDDKHHINILKKVIKFIKDEQKKHDKQAVKVLSWVSKDLLARGHEEASEIIDTVSSSCFLNLNYSLTFV